MSIAVYIKGLRKSFVHGWLLKKKNEVLKGLDLTIPEGSFWGILGPNGAGKTTLLSILSNLLIPEEGEVRVLGMDIRRDAREIHKRMNLSSGHANFLWSLSVKENLQYYAMLYGLSGKRRHQKVEYLLGLFDLEGFAHERFDTLSTGTKQKLSLAKSLVNDPDLLLLDEPTVGLDPDVARRIREAVLQIHRDRGMTVLMTTHNMKEAEALCGQVAFIRDGVIRALGRPHELKKAMGLGDSVLVTFTGILPYAAIEKMEGVYGIQTGDSSCRILVDEHRTRAPQIISFLLSRGVAVRELHIEESDLEDVFIAFSR